MSNANDSLNHERSLLDEIEELNVLEAEELQEGVAFHAFRFHQASSMEGMSFTLNVNAGTVAGSVSLPNGAILMDADGTTLRVLFDPNAVSAQAVQQNVTAAIGANITNVAHNPANKYNIVKV